MLTVGIEPDRPMARARGQFGKGNGVTARGSVHAMGLSRKTAMASSATGNRGRNWDTAARRIFDCGGDLDKAIFESGQAKRANPSPPGDRAPRAS